VGYRSAGTIEMLCDNNKNFYFLEMNTRLQVEHPITELISGEDLVEHMIRVAAGEKLPQKFIDDPHVPFSGWAIESRVYAENPLRNFLPSIGPLNTYKQPPSINHEGNVVRLDTGVFEGGVISMYYDPMIAKLATHANDRTTAITLMEAALSQYVVDGLDNNLCFLHDVMRNPK
jgi:propionyl-CoA carboxylase alpha chain